MTYRAGWLLTERRFACGRTSYDAEMMAGGMGLWFARKQPSETIHIVADNESALQTLLDPGLHGELLLSGIVCRNTKHA